MEVHRDHFAKPGLHAAIEFNPHSEKWEYMVWTVEGTQVEFIDFGREDTEAMARRCVEAATK